MTPASSPPGSSADDSSGSSVPRAVGSNVPDSDPRWKLTPTKYVVMALLAVGIVVPLLVSTYDQIEPRLFGFPFFYWYQLLWVFLAAGLCGLSYWLLQRERAAYDREHPRPTPAKDES